LDPSRLPEFSGEYRSHITNWYKDATNRLAREGVWLGGIVPYGYHVEGEDKNARLVVSDEVMPGCGLSEVEVIRLIYRRCVEDNWACQKIADELNRLGVPPHYVRDGRTTLHGKRAQTVQGIWRAGRIRNMIVNETYKGVHFYGKRSQDEEREVIERAVPAIVSVETWERAQVMLRNRMFMSRRNAKHEYLLRGLIRCGNCGLTYQGTINPKYPEGKVRYYKCNGVSQFRGIYGAQGQKCPSKAVNGEALEAAVWREIEGFLRSPGDVLSELAAQLASETGRADMLRDEMAKMKLRVGAKQAERDTMLTFFRQGRSDAATLDRQLDAIAAEETDLLAELALREGALRSVLQTEDSLRSAETLLQELGARLDEALTFAVRRQVVEMLVERIKVETFEDEAGKKRARATVRYHFGEPSQIAIAARRDMGSLPRRA